MQNNLRESPTNFPSQFAIDELTQKLPKLKIAAQKSVDFLKPVILMPNDDKSQ